MGNKSNDKNKFTAVGIFRRHKRREGADSRDNGVEWRVYYTVSQILRSLEAIPQVVTAVTRIFGGIFKGRSRRSHLPFSRGGDNLSNFGIQRRILLLCPTKTETIDRFGGKDGTIRRSKYAFARVKTNSQLRTAERNETRFVRFITRTVTGVNSFYRKRFNGRESVSPVKVLVGV